MSLRAEEFANQAEQHFAQADAEGVSKIFIPAKSINGMGANNRVAFAYKSIEEAFPAVDCGHEPMGNLVLLQIRQPLKQTSGGILLDTESRKTERDVTQVARVVAVGPLAFKNRNTGELWPEGSWCEVGEFVRIPKYQGDRWHVEYDTTDERINAVTGAKIVEKTTDAVEFVLMKDLALLAKVKGSPLQIRSFL